MPWAAVELDQVPGRLFRSDLREGDVLRRPGSRLRNLVTE